MLKHDITATKCIIYPFQGGTDVEVSGSPTEKAILHWGIEVCFDHKFSNSSQVESCLHF